MTGRNQATYLRVTEIFYSIQGESLTSGLPTVFVRLTGCPLRCNYCDTSYAFIGGHKMTIEAILDKINTYSAKYITVTGGEPLAQKSCLLLLNKLAELDYQVSLETSGALDIANVDNRVTKIVDLKTPSSGESSKNLFANLQYLQAKDQIKLVIGNYEDYLWSKEIIKKHQLNQICEVLFSPSYNQIELKQLAEWILHDNLPVRLQIQLHKHIWGDVAGK